jgi:integrase
LTFTPAKKEGIGIGMRDNGLKYSRRNDVNRYFYPIEWENFLSVIKPKKRLLFIFLLNTGARINEARHVKKRDIDFQRSNVVLIVTKVKARKKERGSKPRRIRISSALTKKLKTACRGLREDEFIFQGNINDKPINKNAVWKMMRKGLKDAGIKDDYNFGLHNIRKTCGNWLTALGVSINEVCSRLGHDIATYQKHYGSPSLFQQKDREMMIKFLGDTYEWKTQQTL